ncbi:ankyrin repeat and LEM domain-containing protein 2 [Triplophysa rosa]|uniref:ankyrin repeat and LEM domain-containing protein 2 n=1 Tax=Triplophysa rosa TaxID=992332 RepID=UPI002545EECC|nr:ankyrin repeat and LEM domain-containing protein 2 [Triplophysa rosa]
MHVKPQNHYCFQDFGVTGCRVIMEEILKRLQTLTPDQLREQITGAGLKCGPITATTRSIFEKKYARALLENQTDGGDSVSQMNSESSNGVEDPQQELSPEAPPITKSPESSSENPPVYYGVCPQPDHPSVKDDVCHVYVDKREALKAVVKLKGARFKAFSRREMAENFSKGLFEGGVSPHKPSPEKSSAACATEWCVSVEKANEFRSPRTQDLTAKLRRAVETGDEESFKNLVWENPRYLIGSGDNPTIVQEGCRYNVLHVAAKENQPEMSRLILETLENPRFMRLMYPHDEELMLFQRIGYILDLYLNTPDKVNNETPLHFACKFGCADVVNVLCSHPYTDKNCGNKYGQKPASIICERRNRSKDVKQKIMEYLEDRFYVPLLRATDNTLAPVIAGPWCPSRSVDQFHEPVMTDAPKNPKMNLKAFVGPLKFSKAEEFHRLWKTPPRDRAEYFHHILKSDWDQGAERVGRELARELGFPWAEYWEFLNCFIDLSTDDGLKMLEEHLSACETFTGRERRSDETPSFQNDRLNGSFGTTQENSSEHDDDDSQRFPVCDLMQEFEKVSVQNSFPSHENTDKSSDERHPDSPEVQTEDDDLSCSSEDYFTADDDEGRCSPSLICSRRHEEVDACSSSGSSFKSMHSAFELLTHTRRSFLLGDSPTKLDNEVLVALNDVDVDNHSYPNITKWKKKVLSHPSSLRQSWPAVSRVTGDAVSSSSVSPAAFRSPTHLHLQQVIFSPLSRL